MKRIAFCLLSIGLVEMTLPEKPNSSKQQYRAAKNKRPLEVF
jgi:hypothetical protein